mmetsp:Transcript_33846/g.85785  ORF Transcript_33846/g.85785 Transcript_33846/m.85785 type:complete len:424 (+) Transcript_33846:76-1347(+)
MPLPAAIALSLFASVGSQGVLAGPALCTTAGGKGDCKSTAVQAPVLLQTGRWSGDRVRVPKKQRAASAKTSSADGSCQDDPQYRDPWWSDSCHGWKGWSCSGFPFSDELQAACPSACDVCVVTPPEEPPEEETPPPVPPATTPPPPPEETPEEQTPPEELPEEQTPPPPPPVTTAPPPVPSPSTTPAGVVASPACENDPEYKDPIFKDDCAGWEGYVCDGYYFSDALKAACPETCGSCGAPAPAPSPTLAPTPAAGSPVDPSLPTPSSGSLDGAMQGILNRHNKYRCMHGAPLMTWSAEIAQNAQEWATSTQGQMQHSPSSSRKNVGGFSMLGENLARGWKMTTAAAVDAWYNEIQYTQGGLVDSFSGATGHYTQVVWKSSTSLGCGTYGQLLVCQYGPAGNYGGMFSSEVAGPVEGAVCEED